MFNAILNWILSSISLLIVARLMPGFIVSGFIAALVASLMIGFVNATLGFILKILTLPLTMVTLGVFWLVINAAMLKLAAALVPGFVIQGFLPAFFGSIVLSLVNVFLRLLSKPLRKEKRD